VSHPFFVLAVALEGQIAWGLDDVESSVDTGPFRDTFLVPYEAAYPDLSHDDLVEAARLATRLGWAARSVNGHLSVDEQSTLRRLEMFVDGRVQDEPRSNHRGWIRDELRRRRMLGLHLRLSPPPAGDPPEDGRHRRVVPRRLGRRGTTRAEVR